MNSQVADEFLKCFASLPDPVKTQARKAYRQWQENPRHPRLQFELIQGHENLWSARVSEGWRVLGLVDGDTITWFWIGSHAGYDSRIR